MKRTIPNRDEKWLAAWRLRESMSESAIARVIGVAPSTVHKWLNPEASRAYNQRDNAKRPDRFRGRCSTCGKTLNRGNRRRSGPPRCRACYLDEPSNNKEAMA